MLKRKKKQQTIQNLTYYEKNTQEYILKTKMVFRKRKETIIFYKQIKIAFILQKYAIHVYVLSLIAIVTFVCTVPFLIK